MDYRNNDLGKIFDKKYTVNKNTSRQISEHQKDFTKRMFGIRDKEEIRKELREANSVNSKVSNLKNRINSITNNNRQGF